MDGHAEQKQSVRSDTIKEVYVLDNMTVEQQYKTTNRKRTINFEVTKPRIASDRNSGKEF